MCQTKLYFYVVIEKFSNNYYLKQSPFSSRRDLIICLYENQFYKIKLNEAFSELLQKEASSSKEYVNYVMGCGVPWGKQIAKDF